MSRNFARLSVKGAGSVIGLFGILLLCVAAFSGQQGYTKNESFPFLMACSFFAFAAYLLHVFYLVWVRFSPNAVRHVCGVSAFFVLIAIQQVFPLKRGPLPPGWILFAYLAALIFLWYAYRSGTEYLNRTIFNAADKGDPT